MIIDELETIILSELTQTQKCGMFSFICVFEISLICALTL